MKKILKRRSGEGYIDVCVLVVCAMLVGAGPEDAPETAAGSAPVSLRKSEVRNGIDSHNVHPGGLFLGRGDVSIHQCLILLKRELSL